MVIIVFNEDQIVLLAVRAGPALAMGVLLGLADVGVETCLAKVKLAVFLFRKIK